MGYDKRRSMTFRLQNGLKHGGGAARTFYGTHDVGCYMTLSVTLYHHFLNCSALHSVLFTTSSYK